MANTNAATLQVPQGDPAYIAWVNDIRTMQSEGRRLILKIFDRLIEGRDAELWRKASPPWQSFERCLQEEHGVHPQRFAHLEACIRRFGRDVLEQYGWESAVHLVRLAPHSPAEKQAFVVLSEMTEKRGGRPPSAEAVARVVDKLQPAPHPLHLVTTESDRLRALIRELEAKLAETKKNLVAERTLRRKLEAQLKHTNRAKRRTAKR